MMKSPAESSPRTEPSILLAADSFKGSASSEAIEKYLEAGVLRVLPHARIKKVLIADGGEGTVDAFVSGCGGEIKSVQAEDPFGHPIVARLGMLPNGYAVVEMAEAAGIRFSSCTDEDARRASTYGVGQLIRAALDLGVYRIYVGLGGSATSDGGCGMAEALGALFLDASGKPVIRGLEGLPYIAHVDMSHFDRRVHDTEIIALSDVNNPLYEKHGAIYTFGPQKGLLFSRLREYDGWMRHYAHTVSAATKDNHALSAGAGAAGGLGFGLLSFCGASAMSGIQALLDAVHFDEQLQGVNLVITGEGRMDNQTAYGKAPVGVARRAALQGIPTYAVVGSHTEDISKVHEAGIQQVFASAPAGLSLEECMKRTPEDVAAAAERAVRSFIRKF